ncbi:MAG: TIM barrel protein [Lachnospiraceae bacterium]
MQIAATASVGAVGDDPILFRGPFEQTIPQMAKLGYKAAELHIYDSDQIDRENVYKLLDENHVTLTSIGTGSAYEQDGICLGSCDPEKRRLAIKRLEGHMKTAAPYEAVVIVGLIAGRVADCRGNKEQFVDNLVTSLKVCAELAEKYGVYLGFEVMNRFESDYGTNISEGLELLKLVGAERVKLHLDTVHLNIEEDDIGAAIRRAKGEIVHVHVADNNRWYPGHAHYNFTETLKALREIGYNKSLALEITNFPDTETAAVKSLAYLKGILEIA